LWPIRVFCPPDIPEGKGAAPTPNGFQPEPVVAQPALEEGAAGVAMIVLNKGIRPEKGVPP
jgi:hypothetical protein